MTQINALLEVSHLVLWLQNTLLHHQYYSRSLVYFAALQSIVLQLYGLYCFLHDESYCLVTSFLALL